MNRLIGTIALIVTLTTTATTADACDTTDSTLYQNSRNATRAAADIVENQPAPVDLDYSLERYNLIRRAYWVNGQREKAVSLPCAIERPLGYIVLFSDSGAIISNFVVDGKVSSLGSYLFSAYDSYNTDKEIPGIDGAYGSNVAGIFFFTIDGKYIEWTGDFLYSDIPFEIDEPVLNINESK